MTALIAGAVFVTTLSAQAAAAYGHSPHISWMKPGAAKIASRLYVSDPASSTVFVYTNDAHPTMIGQITDGLSSPHGMSVDSHGDLYVANSAGNDVTVYHQGATSPFFAISRGLKAPSSVAVGNDGSVYVTEYGGGVLEYHAGAARPFFRIPKLPGGTSSTVIYPADAGIDGSGNLYVYYETDDYVISFGFVVKYPPNSKAGTQLDFINTTHANGIDLDRAGDIAVGWEGSARGNAGIAVFTPSGQRIAHWDRGHDIAALRLGADEKQLYGPDIYTKTVLVYSYPDGHLLRRIPTPVQDNYSMGLAVSPGHRH